MRLDQRVTQLLRSELFRADRIRACISDWLSRSDAADEACRLTDLRQQIAAAEDALGRLYATIEKGTIEVDDPVLKGSVADLMVRRDEAAGLVRMLESSASSDGSIDPAKVEHFVEAADAILRDDRDPRRRALVQLVLRESGPCRWWPHAQRRPCRPRQAVAAFKENQGYLVPSFFGSGAPAWMKMGTGKSMG